MNEDNYLLVAIGRIAHEVRYSTDEEISNGTKDYILEIAEEAINRHMEEKRND